MIGVFICALIREFNWFLFFFLIPFEVIGLLICAVWLVTLTAPAWRLTWTFGEHEITKRLSVFNLVWSKQFAVQPPVQITLRHRGVKEQSPSIGELLSHPDGDYTLSFIGDKNKELLAINGLSAGDARWIADVLLRAFPSWHGAESPGQPCSV